MKKTIQMEELVCPMCAQKIETALQKVDENKTSVDELVKVITGLGYVVI